ncbi:MAG: helix-turn-helix domain-containing protein [Crocinitomicaceae bacterium]
MYQATKTCAKALSLSPNYLSDLLKKETGKTTLEHIHLFLIKKAKNNLLNSSATISEIAYSLGFEYPQRFSNLFKSKTGMSPMQYRHLLRHPINNTWQRTKQRKPK